MRIMWKAFSKILGYCEIYPPFHRFNDGTIATGYTLVRIGTAWKPLVYSTIAELSKDYDIIELTEIPLDKEDNKYLI